MKHFLGFIINSQDHFDSTMEMVTYKSQKPMFGLNGIILKHNLSVNVSLKLFDTLIIH